MVPGFLWSPYEEVVSSNPFGHDAILGNDHPQPGSPYVLESAPPVQVRKNFTASALPLSQSIHPPEKRIDFARGFGLNIPEEEEPEEEEAQQDGNQDESDRDVTQDMEIDEDGDQTYHSVSVSHHTSPSQSKPHSRQTSKISTHLSLGSFGGSDLALSILHRGGQGSLEVPEEIEREGSHVATDDGDAIGEWTATDSSDDGEVR